MVILGAAENDPILVRCVGKWHEVLSKRLEGVLKGLRGVGMWGSHEKRGEAFPISLRRMGGPPCLPQSGTRGPPALVRRGPLPTELFWGEGYQSLGGGVPAGALAFTRGQECPRRLRWLSNALGLQWSPGSHAEFACGHRTRATAGGHRLQPRLRPRRPVPELPLGAIGTREPRATPLGQWGAVDVVGGARGGAGTRAGRGSR